MTRYLLASFLFSAIHVLAYYIAAWSGQPWHRYFPALILFFFLLSFIIGWLLSLAKHDPGRFPVYALASVSLRFITGVLLLVLLLVMKIPDLYTLTLQFVGVYLSYMIFELIMVLSNLRRNSRRNS